MTVKSIKELASSSLTTIADMMNRKAGEIARTDGETARQLSVTATALRDMVWQVESIGEIGHD